MRDVTPNAVASALFVPRRFEALGKTSHQLRLHADALDLIEADIVVPAIMLGGGVLS
jgi:hypothetical protein